VGKGGDAPLKKKKVAWRGIGGETIKTTPIGTGTSTLGAGHTGPRPRRHGECQRKTQDKRTEVKIRPVPKWKKRRANIGLQVPLPKNGLRAGSVERKDSRKK